MDRSANRIATRGVIKRVLVTPEQGMAGNIDGDHGTCPGRTDQDPVGKRRAGTGKTPQAIHKDRARFHVSELLGPLELPGSGIENHQAYFPVEFGQAVELSVKRKRGTEKKSPRQPGLVFAVLSTYHPEQDKTIEFPVPTGLENWLLLYRLLHRLPGIGPCLLPLLVHHWCGAEIRFPGLGLLEFSLLNQQQPGRKEYQEQYIQISHAPEPVELEEQACLLK